MIILLYHNFLIHCPVGEPLSYIKHPVSIYLCLFELIFLSDKFEEVKLLDQINDHFIF